MPEFILWIAIISGICGIGPPCASGSSQQQAMFKTEALCEAAKTKLLSAFAVRGVSVVGACVEYYPGTAPMPPINPTPRLSPT